MTTVRIFAPAKVNLTLHITGRREDGYHLIDSLVAFAPVGDQVSLTPGGVSSLTVEGPEAHGVPSDRTNIALQAAKLVSPDTPVAIAMEKHIPVAAGLGGGSADAAAVWRGMLTVDANGKALADRFWASPGIALETQAGNVASLGADVAMCLASRPLRAQGIGEKLDFLELPALPAVLVNPRVPVSTGAVFQVLESVENSPMAETLPEFEDARSLVAWLAEQRNDLEAPAIGIAPAIGDCLAALKASDDCLLARMSGSGATCFGLYPDHDKAAAAARSIAAERPEWWVSAGHLGDWSARAMPKLSS